MARLNFRGQPQAVPHVIGDSATALSSKGTGTWSAGVALGAALGVGLSACEGLVDDADGDLDSGGDGADGFAALAAGEAARRWAITLLAAALSAPPTGI
jgi:hypothetical protein